MKPKVRTAALALKAGASTVGVLMVCVAIGYVYDELTFLTGVGSTDLGDVVAVLAAVALALCGSALIAQLPESFRVKFRRLPAVAGRRKPVYGFGTLLAIGLGATLGSPLFILIPENVTQYEVISIASLLLATLLSVGMAKVYANMYRVSKALGVDGIGGPSFAKVAVGTRSVRYFVSRLSMWVSNTALAAYTKIVFLIFVLDPRYLPAILAANGVTPFYASVTVYTVAGAFVCWTVLNIVFEQKYLRLLGLFQVLMTGALVLILVYHSIVLGSTSSWNISGLFNTGLGSGWLPALVVNTGYLYLLFFGFQEIQAMQRDAVERSGVPILSWVRKGFTLDRTTYFEVAMVLSVVIASAVNILYGLAVYASHTPLQGSAIPALYLAGVLLGPGQELLVAVAFLIATVTTFVPAFLAAARHLEALGEDGYMPRSLANLSWAFTLVAIFLLAAGNQGFLVDITDFMVLVSLGIISLSAYWLKPNLVTGLRVGKALPLVVGVSCFVFGSAVYAVNPSVVVFGSIAVIFAYLIFDIIELGSLGAQIFLSIFGFVSLTLLTALRHSVYPGGVLGLVSHPFGVDPNTLLVWGLIISSLLLAANVLLDVGVLRKTAVR